MKRTAALGLIMLGTAGVGGYAFYEKNNCTSGASALTPPACRNSGSRSDGTSTGGAFVSGASSSSSSSGSSSSGSISTARGGFGASGGAHSSGS